MIDLHKLEQDPNAFATRLRRRGNIATLDTVLHLVKERKALVAKTQRLQESRNQQNDALKKATPEEREQKRAEMRALSNNIKAEEEALKDINDKLQTLVLEIPNVPHDSVPHGNGTYNNLLQKTVLEIKEPSFVLKDHVELAEHLGWLDTERTVKVSGAGFSFMKGSGARLERALTSFMLDFHLDKGDTELAPPHLVSGRSLQRAGLQSQITDDVFGVTKGTEQTPLFLNPTSEVVLINYYADDIIDEEALPKRFCASSTCFKTEVGYGRSLFRQHHFNNVEMVRFCTRPQAEAELDDMVQRASDIMAALELPHRIILLCTGDMDFGSEKTYNLEIWLPSQHEYREISSCSTCGSFRALRANICYQPILVEGQKKAKPQPLVTLSGSGLAVGRTLAALLENHQQADGSIYIPPLLRPYLGGASELR